MKKQFVTDKKLLLFIDTGDNCRGPMAKGYLQKLLEQKNIRYVEIRTAGVMTPTGLLPTPESVQLLKEENVDISRHRSTPLNIELIKRADLILGMTPFHVQRAIRQAEEARGKTFLLKEYVGREGRNTQIADPMGGTLEIFKKCFGEIKASLQKLMEMPFVTESPAPRERTMVDTTPEALRQQVAAAAEAMREVRAKAKPKPVPKPEPVKAKPRPVAAAASHAPSGGGHGSSGAPRPMPAPRPAPAPRPMPAAAAAKPRPVAPAAKPKAVAAPAKAANAKAASTKPAARPAIAGAGAKKPANKPAAAKPAKKIAGVLRVVAKGIKVGAAGGKSVSRNASTGSSKGRVATKPAAKASLKPAKKVVIAGKAKKR